MSTVFFKYCSQLKGHGIIFFVKITILALKKTLQFAALLQPLQKGFSTFTCSSLQALPQPVTVKFVSNSANPQLPSGSFCRGKNCSTCPYISHGLTPYTFSSNSETRLIKSNLTCDTKNLIYMIQCNRCNLQYIAETKRRLQDHFIEHRRTI